MSLIRSMIDEFNEKHGLVEPAGKSRSEIDYSFIEKRAHITSVKVKRLHPDAVIPKRAHSSDAGFDLVAVEDTIIEPGETALIKTGLAFELPEGFEMQIRPRSGVTLKTKLRVQLGTVDSNYRGEVGVIVDTIGSGEPAYVSLISDISGETTIDNEGNLYDTPTYIVRKGDRIAQAIIQRIPDVELIEVEELEDSERGAAGYGSTGVSSDKTWKEAFDDMVEQAKKLRKDANE